MQWPQRFRSSLTSFRLNFRLELLVIIILIPTYGFIVYDAFKQRDVLLDNARREGTLFVETISLSQARLIDGTRQLLVAFSQLSEVRNLSTPEERARCDALFAELIKHYNLYTVIGVLDGSGTTKCLSQPYAPLVGAADREYFIEAVATKRFSAGQYQIGRVSGKPSINFAYPVLSENGMVTAVTFAGIDLSLMAETTSRVALPPHSTLTITDKAGKVLVSRGVDAPSVGTTISKTLVQQMTTTPEGGMFETRETAEDRLYVYAPLQDESDVLGYVTVSFSRDVIFASANRALVRNTIGLLFIALYATVMAWIVGNVLVTNQIRQKEDFLYRTVHDLRSPSNTIRVALAKYDAAYLRRHPEEWKHMLTYVRVANDRIMHIIQNLLDVASGERTPTYAHTLVHIEETITHVIKQIEPLSHQRDISITYDAEQAVPPVVGDESQITEVFANLIDNAIKYNKKGGTITICHHVTKDTVITEITDTGVGISQKGQDRLFKAYSRIEPQEGIAGTGLGLYSVRRMLERMGGSISVHSKQGKGSTFSVVLPRS